MFTRVRGNKQQYYIIMCTHVKNTQPITSYSKHVYYYMSVEDSTVMLLGCSSLDVQPDAHKHILSVLICA